MLIAGRQAQSAQSYVFKEIRENADSDRKPQEAKIGKRIRLKGCAMVNYEIRDEKGLDVDENILKNYYGNSWRSVFDRLNHKHDGYLLTIHDRDLQFHVYRILTA